MNKKDLVAKVAKETGLSDRAAYRVVSSVFKHITKTMKKEPVKIMGFGTFQTVRRKKRTGRNPQTGEPVPIKAKKVPVFKPGDPLKEFIEK